MDIILWHSLSSKYQQTKILVLDKTKHLHVVLGLSLSVQKYWWVVQIKLILSFSSPCLQIKLISCLSSTCLQIKLISCWSSPCLQINLISCLSSTCLQITLISRLSSTCLNQAYIMLKFNLPSIDLNNPSYFRVFQIICGVARHFVWHFFVFCLEHHSLYEIRNALFCERLLPVLR